MRISPKGRSMIQGFEGLRLESYIDSAGIPTVGWGHTGKGVHPGMVINLEYAEHLLAQDLESFENCVSAMTKVDLTQNQFDAMVSFAYNIGCHAFHDSTLLAKLNKGETTGASMEFSRWVHGGGKVIPGLITRREKERRRFIA